MRRDLIIGILVSILVHGGLGLGSVIFKPHAKKATKTDDVPTIELMKMPEVEPDEPPPTDNPEPAPDVSSIAPPSLADVPGNVQLDSFVQQMQPPPPPDLGKPTGVISIPPGRPNTGGIGKGLGDIFDLKNLDQPPAPKFQAKPVYPFEMRRAGITGEVTVGFIVDSNGDVQQAYAVKSTQREFEAAAIQAVSKWKFRPGKLHGKNVNTRMQVPIVFSISADE
jgi:protein TonB